MYKTNARAAGIGGRVLDAWRTLSSKNQNQAEVEAHAEALNPIKRAYQARLSALTPRGHGTIAEGLFKGVNLQRGGTDDDRELADKLEGRFESQIQEILLKTRNKNFPGILTVGCIDGYYAMGTAVTFMPEVVHVVEPRVSGRARLMANMGVNNITTDIEVDATITPVEVGQIARIYEQLLIILDEPSLTETIINIETIAFLTRSELIVETTDLPRATSSHAICCLLGPTHEITRIDETATSVPTLCPHLDPSTRELATLVWRGKPHTKSWLHAVPRSVPL
jgi:hypothetical protein